MIMFIAPDDASDAFDRYELEGALREASWRPRSSQPVMATTSTPTKPAFMVDCPCCFGIHSAVVRLTVKAMPFLHCKACCSRAFLNSTLALTKLKERHPDVVEKLMEQRGAVAPGPAKRKRSKG